MRPRPHPLAGRRRAPRGYALILVMVVLVVLTILGVTSITSAQLDMKIAQNMRQHTQLAYGALAGQDHARNLIEDSTVDSMAAYETAAAQPNNCISAWLSPTATSPNTASMMSANSTNLSTYTVDFCTATCGQPPPGNQINEAGDGSLFIYTMDMVATGNLSTMTSSSQAGGLLMSPPVRGVGCNNAN